MTPCYVRKEKRTTQASNVLTTLITSIVQEMSFGITISLALVIANILFAGLLSKIQDIRTSPLLVAWDHLTVIKLSAAATQAIYYLEINHEGCKTV